MPDADDVQRLRDAASGAVKLAQSDLTRLLDAALLKLTPEQLKVELPDLLLAISDRYGDMLATAAAEWYDEVRDAPGSYSATLGSRVREDMVNGTVKYAMKYVYDGEMEATKAILSAAMQRWVQYSGRSTIARNVKLDPAKPRFARVPTGPVTCSWCAMLASRGWVYHSRESAGNAMRFHEHCDCQIVPSWSKKRAEVHLEGYDPDALFRRYEAARESLAEEHGPSTVLTEEMIAKRMAKLEPAWYTDEIKLPQMPGTSRDGSLQRANYWRTRQEAMRDLNALGDMARASWKIPPEDIPELPGVWPPELPGLSAHRWAHIMFGDRTGGGHAAGYGWRWARDEFPKSWSADDILDALQTAAKHWIQTGGMSAGRTRDITVNGVLCRITCDARKNSAPRVTSFTPVGR